MRLSEIMHYPVITVGATDTLATARELMRMHHIRHLPVIEDGHLVGVITQTDIHTWALEELEKDEDWLEQTEVERSMTRRPATLRPKDTAHDAANLMRANKIDCVPIVEHDKILGIVTASDLLEFLSRKGGPSRTRPITQPRMGHH